MLRNTPKTITSINDGGLYLRVHNVDNWTKFVPELPLYVLEAKSPFAQIAGEMIATFSSGSNIQSERLRTLTVLKLLNLLTRSRRI
jgi:hypothetical protein